MKAIYIKAPFESGMREVTLRAITDNEVLVKVKACGICGTDYTNASYKAAEWEPVGHEISGIIEQVGSGVLHLEAGNTVVLETSTFCRTCHLCRNGRTDLCSKGPNFWGEASLGFAEYIIVPQQCVVPYTGLSFEAASLTEPLGVALDLVYTADIKLGDDVLVVGMGPIGLMAVRLAKEMGARRIYAAARSHSAARAVLAKRFGADEVIYTDKVPLDNYSFENGGVDRILITTPPQTIPAALRVAKTGGVIAFIGIEYGSGATISFDANEFHFKKLQLRGSMAAPALYFPKGIELLKSGVIDAESLISHTFPLDRFGESMKALRDDKGSTVKMVMVDRESTK